MNGLMAFGDKGRLAGFLASNSWRGGGLQRALLQGREGYGLLASSRVNPLLQVAHYL
ncbi:hypothetical protein METHP14_330016 [Pseudomonas sp. P14-2025]